MARRRLDHWSAAAGERITIFRPLKRGEGDAFDSYSGLTYFAYKASGKSKVLELLYERRNVE